MTGTRYFHGGQRGLRAGDMLRPPSETGAKNTIRDFAIRSGLDRQPQTASRVGRNDRVYVTTDPSAAEIYAIAHPSAGWLYEVEPVGPLEDDPDCNEVGLSFACRAARVLSVRPISGSRRRRVLQRIARELGGSSLAGGGR